MATSGIVKTSILDDSYFWVRWNIQKSSSSTNSTTINWSCGVNPGHQYYTNALKIGPIKINTVQVYEGGTLSDITDYQEHTFSSGTLTIEHESDGTKTFTIASFYGWIHESGNTWSSEKSFELPALNVYSNCTGPTSITFKLNGVSVNKNIPYYLIPGDEIIVNWSGQQPGNNNPITGYDVYYYFSNDNSKPTTTVYSGKYSTTNSSLKITIAEKRRGTYLRVGVVTKSSHNITGLISSNSSYQLMVNVRPDKPSVSKTSFVFKSTETSTTIKTISPGKLNFGSQVNKVKYATSMSGTRTEITNGQLTNAVVGTYYFWTYDGKEYSSDCTSVKVSKNTKPAINNWGLYWDKRSTIKNNSEFKPGTDNKIPTCLEEVHFTIKGNKQGYYDLVVNGGSTTITLISKGALSTSETTTKVFKIRELGLPLNSYLTFSITPYDNLERGESDSKSEWKDSNNKTYIYKNPSLPLYIDTYNQFDNSNISNTTSRNFYQKIRVRFSYDSYFLEKGYIKLNQGTDYLQGNYTVKKDKNDNPQYIVCDFTASGNLTSGKIYYLSLIKQLFSQTSPISLSYKRTPTFDPTPKSSFIIKPFTDGANETCSKDIKIQKPTFTGDFYEYFNLNENDYWTTELIINGNSIDLSSLLKKEKIDLTSLTDYAVKKLQFSGSKFFDKITESETVIPVRTRKGKIKAILKNTVKNLFGQTISGQAQIVTLDFDEESIITFIDNFSAWHYLFEGYNLSTTCNIKTYSPNDITFQLLFKKGSESTVVYDSKKTNDFSPPNFNAPRNISLPITKVIPEIKDAENGYFSAKVLNGNTVIKTYNYNKGNPYHRLRHTSPIISFDKAVYSENSQGGGEVSVNYNLSDIGTIPSESSSVRVIERTLTLTLEIEGQKYPASSSPNGEGLGSTTFNLGELKITNFKNGRLKLETNVTYKKTGAENYIYNNSKTGFSNTYTIYGIAPTIAYRKNSLGINTTTIQNDSVLTIAPSSNRNVIYFLKEGSNETFKINLATGQLIDFNIDCGEIS